MTASALLTTLAAVAAAVSSLSAGDAPAGDAPAEKPAARKSGYEAKSKSSFDLDQNARPPFWPIGWVKRETGAVVAKATGPGFKLEEKNYTVTSILTGPPALAVINGRAYEEGQFLRIPRAAVKELGNEVPRIRVHRILDGKVWLSCANETIAVGLKRGEFKEPKGDEMLLNEDKDFVEPSVPVLRATPSVSRR